MPLALRKPPSWIVAQVAGPLLGMAGLIGVAQAEEAISASPVQRLSDEVEVIGASTLVRDAEEGRVSMSLNTRELQGDAPYTMWWVVFNNPELCATACGCGADADFENAEATGVGVFWATGRGSDRFGQAVFDAQVDVGELPEGEDQVPFDEFARPIANADEAEIHLVVRAHGRLIPSRFEEQISQFNGGCPPRECVDVQFSVHRSPTCTP